MITLTFDDGVLNTYEVAFPIMERYGIKGVAFIITGILTGEVKDIRKDGSLYMNLDQIKELHRSGWEIGSHSVTHPRFDKLTLKDTRRELEESLTFLQSHGFVVESFAFPFGHGLYLPYQISFAHEYYKWVRTVCHEDPMLVDSIPIDNFPPEPVQERWKVYLMHIVRNPKNFEKWISGIEEKVTTFKRLTSAR